MFIRTLVLASFMVLFSQSAHASFFALCDFEIEVTGARPELHLVAGTVYTRQMEGKILKASDTSPSHINCEQTYTGKDVKFPLQVKNGDGNLKVLASVKVGEKILVHFDQTNGLTPWGVVYSENWNLH